MSAKAKKAKKPRKLKNIKKDAWDAFSMYIRTRDCLKTTGCPDWGLCITCGKRYHIKLLQAGHFVSGRHNGNLFSEKGVHDQCLTKHSKLRMFNGQYKSIGKIKAGDILWGFDENNFIKKVCTVESVKKFTPKELYKVETENGDVFYATPTHKIVVNKKWVKIKDLLTNHATHDILEL